MAYKRDKAFMTHKLQLPGDSKKDVTSRNICLEITFHTEFQLTFRVLYICPLSIFIHPASRRVSLAQNALKFVLLKD